MAWLGRFGLHLAAAVGATGIFVAAAAVGAHQARPEPSPAVVATSAPERPARVRRATPGPTATPRVNPERSLTGIAFDVQPDHVMIRNARGQEWRVAPAPGALIRINGEQSPLEAIQSGDRLIILGQAQPRMGFLAHAITIRRR